MSTSRVGRKPITVPSGVDVKILDQRLTIKGPKGQSSISLHPLVQIDHEGNIIKLSPTTAKNYTRSGIETKLKSSIVGTLRAKINNVITGVTAGFERKLILVGVGYRAQAKGKVLSLSLGFSHPVNFTAPEGITIETPSQTEVVIKGIDKNLVGQIAATIRATRGPEPYKGKGVRYSNEVIKLKETKKK
jgi:large subunit ribosomal protein L6